MPFPLRVGLPPALVQLALLAPFVCACSALDAAAQSLTWTDLPAIPDPEGFAGPIAGLAGDKLIVAGGANFPDRPPWEGGTKRWYDEVRVLDHPGGQWRTAGRLHQPLAYSVCITTPRGVAVLGGSNVTGHTRDCFWLRLADENAVTQVDIQPLPPLPLAISNACGGLLDGRLYLAGGSAGPDAVRALAVFISLDLAHPELGWRNEPTWPGHPRMLAVAATHEKCFYLLGGVALSADHQGRPQRAYLRDAYQFSPRSGWSQIRDLPWPLAAGPSPAPAWGPDRFLILGGDDGSQVSRPPREHTGFRRDVLAFSPHENRWATLGAMPTALVTTTALAWRGRIVVPGGEVRPGVRSTRVLSASVP